MLVLLTDAVLSDPAQWLELEALLDHARRNRCYLDALTPAFSLTNPWLDQADRGRKQQWLDVTAWAVRDASLFRLRALVADVQPVGAPPPARVSVRQAIDLVARPASIWLENGRNDRRFLLASMPEDQRTMFLKWERDRVISFENGGGLGEMRKLMEEQDARGMLDARADRALFDSDAEAPGHRSRDAVLMTTFCRSRGIAHHCLDRRAIENYLPRAALWWWANTGGRRDIKSERRAKVEAYSRLNDRQRWHFHLKSGWVAQPSQQVIALYADVAQNDRDILQNGVDRDLALLYDGFVDAMYAWMDEEGFDAGLKAAIEEMTDWIRVPYA